VFRKGLGERPTKAAPATGDQCDSAVNLHHALLPSHCGRNRCVDAWGA
jgi:hypothetical protein